jgi:hypothetical protein
LQAADTVAELLVIEGDARTAGEVLTRADEGRVVLGMARDPFERARVNRLRDGLPPYPGPIGGDAELRAFLFRVLAE